MMETFEGMRKQLSELASVLNEFKSEAVQLRILDLVLAGEPTDGAEDQPAPRKTARRVQMRGTTKPQNASSARPGKRKKAPSGTGSPSTLTQLLSGTFFDKARTINDIIEHCKHNLARTFKANEFSGKLGRMVRNNELTRKKNTDNQYEYKKP